MTPKQLKKAGIEQVLSEYRRAAATHREASQDGNYKLANRNVRVLQSCYREIRTRGEAAKQEFLTLLDNSDEGVRLWAAANALEFAPERGEPVLTELEASGTHGLIRTDAHYTLEEWRRGRLSSHIA